MTTKIFYLIEKYLENITTKQNLSQNTFLSYKNDIIQFFKYFDADHINDIKESNVTKYLMTFDSLISLIWSASKYLKN